MSSRLWRSAGCSLLRVPATSATGSASSRVAVGSHTDRERWYSSGSGFMPVTSLTEDEQMMKESGMCGSKTPISFVVDLMYIINDYTVQWQGLLGRRFSLSYGRWMLHRKWKSLSLMHSLSKG